MKKTLTWLSLLFLLMMASCGSSDPSSPDGDSTIPEKPIEKDEIILSNSGDASVVFKSEATTKEIEFKTSKDWNVIVPSTVASWLSVAPSSGNKGTATITLDAQTNPEMENRVAEITLVAGKSKMIITVTQMQKDALVIAKNSYTVASDGGELSIEIGHNVDYDLEIDGDWIHQQTSRAYEKDQLTFSVDKNPYLENREGLLTFTSKDGSLKQEVKVYQSELKGIIVSAPEKIFDEKTHVFDVEIKANVDYEVIDPQVDWLKRIESRALTSRTLRYELQENTTYDSRSAKIIINSNEGSDTVTVSQMQKDAIIIAKKEYKFDWNQHQLDFEVKTNVDLQVKSSADWIKPIESSRGLSDRSFHFTIEINEQKSTRQGVITIGDGELKQEIAIVQEGFNHFLELPDIDDSSHLACRYDDEGTFRFKVHTDGPYHMELVGDTTWLIYRGAEQASENMYYEYFDTKINNTDKERKCKITFRLGPISHSFYFAQAPKRELVLSQKEFAPSKDGDSFTLEIKQLFKMNDAYRIYIPKDAPWLTVKNVSSETGGTAVFTAEPNLTSKKREADVRIVAWIGEIYTVHVTQAGSETLIFSDNEYIISSKPSSLTIDVVTDKYTIDFLEDTDWVKAGKKWKEGDIFKQELLLSENLTGHSRKTHLNFMSGSTTNQIEITQLEKAPELEERAPEKWLQFSIPKVNFITPNPNLKGVHIYNAIVPDPEKLIGVVSRMVLDELYYSPDDEFIPKRESMNYIVEDFDGVSYFSGGLQSKIALSTSYLENYYNSHDGKSMIEENIGILSHELTHCYQLRPQGIGDYNNKVFHACIEGTADAVRVLCGKFTEKDRPHGGSYMNSYRFTGFFLAWLTNNKDKDFLRKFNLSTQYVIPWSFDGAIKYALGDEYNVDDLWDEYQRAVGDR